MSTASSYVPALCRWVTRYLTHISASTCSFSVMSIIFYHKLPRSFAQIARIEYFFLENLFFCKYFCLILLVFSICTSNLPILAWTPYNYHGWISQLKAILFVFHLPFFSTTTCAYAISYWCPIKLVFRLSSISLKTIVWAPHRLFSSFNSLIIFYVRPFCPRYC